MITTYSNGWGHLIFSLAVLFFVGFLLFFQRLDLTAAIGLITPVVTFWFISGARFQGTPATTTTSITQPTPASLQPQNEASTPGILP